MSRCAGAGGGHSQTDSPSWLMEIFHAVDIMLSVGMGFVGGRKLSAVSCFCEFEVLGELCKSPDFGVL